MSEKEQRTENEQLPLRVIHVHVLLKETPRRTEWRQVYARDLYAAHVQADGMPDVKQVYEVSLEPGGTVT